MLGGRRATTPLLVLVLSVLAEKQLLVEANTCLCKEDFTPDIIQAISEFSHENLVDRVHTYTGAKSVNNKYEPCICEDVTRLEVKLSTPKNDVDLTEEETTSLVANMTSELYQRFPIDVTDGDFITDLDLISYNVTSEITATSFNFVVLVTLRGRNSSYSNLPEPITLPSSDSTLTLNSVTVLQCAGDPPAPLTNGKDNTAEGKLAGAKAHYTCDTGFMNYMTEPTDKIISQVWTRFSEEFLVDQIRQRRCLWDH
ncbi:uncharacterized protein LOC121871983 [Homarus americanus]|uniref:uncharacterized protein LOC121858858 n=1 Tax=Homarus americanus TaxID=6706 RepID=UPI001C455FC0|nr:uncharacterized protein LOC121858858 [Homarus americanus]XP_042230538.1 uncharacterized protein LOC121871983 [Homarus americanus]